MIATDHAKQRWRERFPGLDMEVEYSLSRGIGQGKMFRRVRDGLADRNLRKMLRYGGSTYMLLTKRSGAVFVVDKGEVVITVLQLPDGGGNGG